MLAEQRVYNWMAYRSFEELEVWKKSCRLAVRMYEALRACKDFGLKDQMTRSAVSIASNIAEGAERGSRLEFIRFLHIAKGSAAELRTQVYIAQQIEALPVSCAKELINDLKTISAMLQNLIKTLKPKT
ncbi:MAG: four helix bundle protein [Desulfomicrobium sp.]|nr:four helix bundle protein [Desulfomicrobium sp.]